MIHLFFSSISAAVSLAWARQLKKAKEAHKFIKEEIHNELEELDHLKTKYVSLLNKESQKRQKRGPSDKEKSSNLN